jgi:hypothetical protein
VKLFCHFTGGVNNTVMVLFCSFFSVDGCLLVHLMMLYEVTNKNKETPWTESASELYRPSHRRLLSMLVPTFDDKVCHVVSVTDPYGRNIDFQDRSLYFFFQVAPQLYSRG